jgi:hypothetical protein
MQVTGQGGLNCQNNKQNVLSIHVMAQKLQNNKQNVHFMGFALQNKHLRASPSPHGPKKLLYFRMEYGLMITAPTHKRHKSPFKHSKTIYVFTSV